MKKFATLAASAAALLFAHAAQAALVFTYGTPTATGTPDEFDVAVSVSSTDNPVSVTGVDLISIINDGGTALGGVSTTPVFVGVDLKPIGGLFSSFPDAPTEALSDDQANQSRLISNPPQTASIPTSPVLLAELRINTAGLSGSTFTLSNSNILIDSINPTFSTFSSADNGQDIDVLPTSSVVVVPEPAALGVLAMSGLLLLRRRRSAA